LEASKLKSVQVELSRWGGGRYKLDFAVRNSLGDVVLVGIDQNRGFKGVELKEARPCLLTLKKVVADGLRSTLVRDDNKASWRWGAYFSFLSPRSPLWGKKFPSILVRSGDSILDGNFYLLFFPYLCETYITIWVLGECSRYPTTLAQLIVQKALVNSMDQNYKRLTNFIKV